MSRHGESQRRRPGSQRAHRKHPTRSAAEWVAFGVSAAILLAVLGAIVFFWLTQHGEPQIVISRAGEIRQVGQQFYVPFEARNLGGVTVADVQITAELRIGAGEPRQIDQLIPFLAGGESERGAFIFADDPRLGELTLLVTSYLEP